MSGSGSWARTFCNRIEAASSPSSVRISRSRAFISPSSDLCWMELSIASAKLWSVLSRVAISSCWSPSRPAVCSARMSNAKARALRSASTWAACSWDCRASSWEDLSEVAVIKANRNVGRPTASRSLLRSDNERNTSGAFTENSRCL